MADDRAHWRALMERAAEVRREAAEVEARTEPAVAAHTDARARATACEDDQDLGRLLDEAMKLLPAYTEAQNARERAREAAAAALDAALAATPQELRDEAARLDFEGKLELARRASRVPPEGHGIPH